MCTAILPPQYFIHRLERRRSSTPRPQHHHRPLTEKLSHLDPTTWLAPAVLRAHDAHEYRKDRRRREEIYRSHHRRPEERARVHRDVDRNGVFFPEGGTFSHAKTMSSSTGTTTTGTTTTMEVWPTSTVPLAWESVVEARSLRGRRTSEMSLNDRARALEWAGSTSVFSLGVLQDWMIVSDTGWWRDQAVRPVVDDRFGPDPWALRPLQEMF